MPRAADPTPDQPITRTVLLDARRQRRRQARHLQGPRGPAARPGV